MASYNPKEGKRLYDNYRIGTLDPASPSTTDEQRKNLFQYQIDNDVYKVDQFRPEVVKNLGLTAKKVQKVADKTASVSANKAVEKKGMFQNIVDLIPKKPLVTPPISTKTNEKVNVPNKKTFEGMKAKTPTITPQALPKVDGVGFRNILQDKVVPKQETGINPLTFKPMTTQAPSVTPFTQSFDVTGTKIEKPRKEVLFERENKLKEQEDKLNRIALDEAEKAFYSNKINEQQLAKQIGYKPLTNVQLNNARTTWSDDEYEDYLNKKEKYNSILETKLLRPNVAIQKSMQPSLTEIQKVDEDLGWKKDWNNAENLRTIWRSWSPTQKEAYTRLGEERLAKTGQSFFRMTDEYAKPRVYSDNVTNAWDKGLKITNVGEITEGGLLSYLDTNLALEKYKKMQGEANKVEDIENYLIKHPELKLSKHKAIYSPTKIAREGVGLLSQIGVVAKEAIPYGLSGGATGAAYGSATGPGALVSAKVGAEAGYKFGLFDTMRKIETANTYDELINNGVDEIEARKIADTVGIANGTLELLELKMIGDFAKGAFKATSKELGKEVAKKEVIKNAVNVALKGGVEYGKFLGKEVGQELVQESIAIAGLSTGLATRDAIEKGTTSEEVVLDYAKALARGDKNVIEEAKKFVEDNKDRLSETAITSLQGFLFTGGLAGIGGAVTSKLSQNDQNKIEKINQIKNIVNENMDNNIEQVINNNEELSNLINESGLSKEDIIEYHHNLEKETQNKPLEASLETTNINIPQVEEKISVRQNLQPQTISEEEILKTPDEELDDANYSVKYKKENELIDSLDNKTITKNKSITEILPRSVEYINNRANELISDINNTNKEENISSETISNIKDNLNISYDKIKSSLNNIVSGGKQTAIDKKIQSYIDKDLIDGYKTFEGIEIEPNKNYRAIRGKTILEDKTNPLSFLFGEEEITTTNENITERNTKNRDELVKKIERMTRKNIDKEQTIRIIKEIYDGAIAANKDIELVFNMVNSFQDEITESMLKDHGIQPGTKAYIGGRSFIEKNGSALKLTAEVLNDRENFMQQEVVHEFAELYVEMYRKNNKEQFDAIIKELQDNSRVELDYMEAREMVVELMVDRKLQKEVVEQTDIPTSKIMKFIHQFTEWFIGVAKRVKFYKENVWDKLPEELQKQAELFEQGRWDEVFSSIKDDSEVKTLSQYSVKENDNFKKWFEGSIVKDENENPIIVYHGSPNKFTEFKTDLMGKTGTVSGRGFYFTDNKDFAEKFSSEEGQIIEAYLNLKKPLSNKEITIDRKDLIKFIKDIDPTGDEFLSNYGNINKKGYDNVLKEALDIEYKYSKNDVDLINGIFNIIGGDYKEFFDKVESILGYDGIVVKKSEQEGGRTEYIVFKPNQIKSTENIGTFDTKIPDIMFSYKGEMLDPILERYKEVFGGKEEFTEEDRLEAKEKGKKIRGKMDKLYKQKVINKIDKEISKLKIRDAVSDTKIKERKLKQEAIDKIKQKLRTKKDNERVRKIERQAQKDLLKKVKFVEVNKKKWFPFAVDAAEEIIGNLDSKSIRLGSKAKLEKARDFFDSMKQEDETYEIPEALKNKLKRLDNTFIIDMTLDDIKAMQDALDHIIRVQELKSKLISGNTLSELSESTQDMINVIGEDKSEWIKKDSKIKDFFRYIFFTGALEPKVLSMYVGKGKDSTAYKYLFDEFNKAQNKRRLREQVFTADFEAKTKNIDTNNWSTKDNVPLFQKDQNKKVMHNRKFYKIPSGNIALSRFEKISLYLHTKNEDNIKHLLNGGARITDRRNPYIFTKEDIEFIKDEKFLTRDEKLVANAIFDFFNGAGKDLINRTSVKLDGFERATVSNYFPIDTDKRDMDMNFSKFKNKITLEGNKHLKERTSGENPILLLDANDLFERQVKFVSEYSSFAVPLRNAKIILGQNNLRNALVDKYGKQITDVYSNFFNQIEGVKPDYNEITKGYFKLISNAQQAIFGLNPWIGIQQFSSIPSALAEINAKYLVPALAMPAKKELMKEYSPLLWERTLGGAISREAAELEKAKIKDRRKPLAWTTQHIFMIDNITMSRIWNAVELETKDLRKDLEVGSTEYYEHVAKRAEYIIEATQPTYALAQRSDIARTSDPLVRSLTLFTSAANKNYNILAESYFNFNNGNRKKATAQLSSVIASGITFSLINTLRSQWKGYGEDDKEDEFAKQFLQFMTGNIYFVGAIYNFLSTGFGDKNLGTDTIFSLFKDLASVFDTDSTLTYELRLKRLMLSIAKATGVPIGNVIKEFEYGMQNIDPALYLQYNNIFTTNPKIESKEDKKISEEYKKLNKKDEELYEAGKMLSDEEYNKLNTLSDIKSLNNIDKSIIKNAVKYNSLKEEEKNNAIFDLSYELGITEEEAGKMFSTSTGRRDIINKFNKRIKERSKN